jgi:hypothetical protein
MPPCGTAEDENVGGALRAAIGMALISDGRPSEPASHLRSYFQRGSSRCVAEPHSMKIVRLGTQPSWLQSRRSRRSTALTTSKQARCLRSQDFKGGT